MTASSLAQETEFYAVDVGPNRGAPWQVIKYDENGENPVVFVDSQLNRPQDIVFLEQHGVALVSSLASGRITRHDISTGEFIDDFATGIGQPTRMEIRDNLLYVLQWQGNGRVWRYDLDGNFVDEFTTVGVTNSIGMDWDSEGNLYVASFDAQHVRKFDPEGNDLGLFVTTNLQGPTNIWFVENGDLLVMDWNGQAIRRYGPDGTFKSNFVLGLSEPEGVEFLENGDFLIGNGGTSSVRQYDSNGNFVGDFVPAGLGGLAKPNALRFRKIPGFALNPGLNGSWANFDTLGQGFFIDVLPTIPLVFLAWFTYEVAQQEQALGSDGQHPAAKTRTRLQAVVGDDNHRWLTAQGPFEGNVANLAVTLTTGGIFDDPAPTENTSAGTITLTFSDCENGTVEYDFPGSGLSGTVPLRRLGDDNVGLCESLSTQ